MIMMPRFALSLILGILPCTAMAQQVQPTGIVIEATPESRAKSFVPGAPVTLRMVVRNTGDEAVTLRRVVLNASPDIVLTDPATDGVDNDENGETDEADEAYHRQEDDGAVMRFGTEGVRIEPGDSVTRRVRVALDDDALPGLSEVLTLTARTILADARPAWPQNTEQDITLRATPVAMTLMVDDSAALGVEVGVTTTFDGVVTLPGGTVPDGRVTLTLPPALNDATIQSYRIGDAITCDDEPETRIEEDAASLYLGRCAVDADAAEDARSVRLSVSTNPAASPAQATRSQIADWRALSVYLGFWNDDTLLDGKVKNLILRGARLVATTIPLSSNTRLEPGDTVTMRLTVENRGDSALSDARVTLLNPQTFRCDEARVEGAGEIRCIDNIVTLPKIDAESTLDIALDLRLRNDALIDTNTGPALEVAADGIGKRSLPVPRMAMALHEAPTLRVVDRGAWAEQDGVLAATIGDGGRLRLSGVLPPGRYPGEVRLLARAVDARTGMPVAPATLIIPDPDLTITTLDGDRTGTTGDPTTKTGTLWAQYVIPFDLSEATEGADQNRRFTVDFDVALGDDPAIAAGHLLEITAESAAYGDSTAPSTSWVEILVREPELRLKMFSLDEDRVIQPTGSFGIVSLACNYGDSPAHGAILTLDTPMAVDLEAADAVKRPFLVPLDAVRGGSLDMIAARSTDLASTMLTTRGKSLVLSRDERSLHPEFCIGIELRTPLHTDRKAAEIEADAVALTVLAPYGGNGDDRTSRDYASARTPPLRFQMPMAGLGPSTTIQIGDDRRIEHPITLTVPASLGAFRVSLAPRSSTQLDWSLFEQMDEEDVATPWLNNGRTYPAGSTVGIVMRTTAPDRIPLGWVDTSRVEAQILTDDGHRLAATLRLVVRTGTGSARAITTEKRIALDRDCDGDLGDERVQDSVFEPVKDATPGDCIVVRIAFENAGAQEVERIIIRDAVSTRTTLLPDTAEVRIAPEPLDSVTEPDPEGGPLAWEFKGLFRPGAVGEVEYRLRLDPL